jgi:hypothetical protein
MRVLCVQAVQGTWALEAGGDLHDLVSQELLCELLWLLVAYCLTLAA